MCFFSVPSAKSKWSTSIGRGGVYQLAQIQTKPVHGKAAWTPCTAVHSDEILSSRAMSSARLLPPAAPAMPRETGRNRETWWVTMGKPGGLARFLTCRLDPLQLFEPQKETVTMCLVISKNATRMFGYVWSCLATHSQCLECRFHA